MKDLSQAKITGKKVILRTDYNVPTINGSKIADTSRIQATLPTLRSIILKRPSKLFILTHWDRPKKEGSQWRLLPIAEELLKIFKKSKLAEKSAKVKKISLASESPVLKTAYELTDKIIMLENVRFDSREEKNDTGFAKELARLADVYINDAFASSHRAHASVAALAKELPAYPGILFKEEIRNLKKMLENPAHPFAVIIGGIKLEDKLPATLALAKVADKVLVGGRVGLELLGKGEPNLVLPLDGVTAKGAIVRLSPENVGGQEILDIGPQTIQLFKRQLNTAKTIFWNGCLGKVEDRKFVHGSYEIARFIVNLRAVKIISGGDTAAMIAKLGLEHEFNFISTGGGATLEFLAGKKLPGLEALK